MAKSYREKLEQWRTRRTETVVVNDPDDGEEMAFVLHEPRGAKSMELIVAEQGKISSIEAESGDAPVEVKNARLLLALFCMYRTMLRETLVDEVSDEDLDAIVSKFGMGSALYDAVMTLCKMESMTTAALKEKQGKPDTKPNRAKRRAAGKGKGGSTKDLPFGSRAS